MEINLNFEFADIYKEFIDDFLRCGHKEYSLFGGRNNGKSTTAYMLELLTVLTSGCVMVVRRTKASISGSSFNGVKQIINKYNLNKLFKATTSPFRITCLLNGYVINFSGLDDPEKVKSAIAPVGTYQLLVFEECQENKMQEPVDEVISTFNRGVGSDTFKVLYIFNPPPNKNHWCNLKLRKDLYKDNLLKVLEVCYLDIPSEWVGDEIRKINQLKENNYKLYKHRYLGYPISVEDVIFENIKIEAISNIDIEKWESDDDFIFNGLDFGWTDPNAAISCHYDIDNRILYIYREFYGGHLNSVQLYKSLLDNGFDHEMRIIADSASPDKIADLKEFGLNIKGCNKKAVSVKSAFEWLMGLNAIVIDPDRCPNAATEFEEYHYEIDRDGGIPSSKLYKWDQSDHTISATRYALERLINKAGI